jgi:hypothetical protein
MMDRDGYIWCDLSKRVNAAGTQRVKICRAPVEAVNNLASSAK